MNYRALLAATSTVVSVLVAGGCALAARLELSGFGRPRDTEPRIPYLLVLAVAALASVAVTWVLYRWAGIRSVWVPVGLVVATGVVGWSLLGATG